MGNDIEYSRQIKERDNIINKYKNICDSYVCRDKCLKIIGSDEFLQCVFKCQKDFYDRENLLNKTIAKN